MLGSAKAETQLTIIEVTEHDLFLSPGVIPSQYIYIYISVCVCVYVYVCVRGGGGGYVASEFSSKRNVKEKIPDSCIIWDVVKKHKNPNHISPEIFHCCHDDFIVAMTN